MIRTQIFAANDLATTVVVNFSNSKDIWTIKKAYEEVLGRVVNIINHHPTTAELVGKTDVVVIYDDQEIVALTEEFTGLTQEVRYVHSSALVLPDAVHKLIALVPYVVNHYISTLPVDNALRLEWEGLLSDIGEEEME